MQKQQFDATLYNYHNLIFWSNSDDFDVTCITYNYFVNLIFTFTCAVCNRFTEYTQISLHLSTHNIILYQRSECMCTSTYDTIHDGTNRRNVHVHVVCRNEVNLTIMFSNNVNY